MTGTLLYALLVAACCVPGLPLGFALFGRRHAAGWIAGGLIGYAAACVIGWAAMRLGGAFGITAVAGWLVTTLATFALVPWRRGALIDLGAWSRKDSLALGAVLLLGAVIAIVPLRRVGERDAVGNRQYRAYFTADFLWHMALTSELTKGSMPPRNPYLATQPIHYYWTYFLVPSAVARTTGIEIATCLKANAVASGLFLLSAIFMAAHAVVRRAMASAVATAAALVASSAEGAYVLWRIWHTGAPLSAVRGLNVDALAAWYFQGHRIDGLQRCLWYVPQHSMAYALGLIGVTAGAAALSGAPPAAIVIVGVALAASVMMNPFVGGLFALAWGIACTLNALREPMPLKRILRHLLAVIPVLVALAWCVSNRMVEGAGGTLLFGWGGASRNSPAWNLMLSLGPALAPALLLLALRPSRAHVRSLLPAISLAVISLVVMHTVRLSVDEPWVPFRAGQMLLAVVPAIVACTIVSSAARGMRRTVAAMVLIASLAVGLPTTIIDAYNAQDVTERGSGAGFHWTLVLSREEQEAFDWIRQSTPRTAIVQMEPTVRDRDLSPGGWGEHWSAIPSFAERRMTAGIPISLLRVPAYTERSERVRDIFSTADPQDAHAAARALRIDYLYVDAKDRDTYPYCAKFDAAPDLFEPVFRLGAVAVYRVR